MSHYRMGVPAGMSSEDEDSDDGFEFSVPNFKNKPKYSNNYFNQSNTRSPAEQLNDAIRNGDLSAIKELLTNNQINETNINDIHSGWTPLMYACYYGFPDILTILLENGANINFHKEFLTPLMAVCSNPGGNEDNRLKCIEILLQHNVDVNAADRFRSTSLMLASKEGYSKIVQKLIDSGCEINKIDYEGQTALHHGVLHNRSEVVDVLINARADIEIKDIRGRTPFDLATIKGFAEIADKVAIKKEVEETEDEYNLFNVSPVKTVEQMLHELPSNSSGKNPGFSSDVYGLLYGMNMEMYVPCFYKNNIQLGEFLVMNNEQLKELGVRFSAHRQKILLSLKKFHLYRWQKTSIGLKPRNEKIELIDALKLIANCVRQLHVIQSSIFYLQCNKPKTKSTDEFKKTVTNAFNQSILLQKELNVLKTFAKFIDSSQIVKPVDLITDRQNSGKNVQKFIKISAVCFLGGIFIWKNKEFCYSVWKLM